MLPGRMPTTRHHEDPSLTSMTCGMSRTTQGSDHCPSLAAGPVEGVGGGLGEEVGRDPDLHVHGPVVKVAVQADRTPDQADPAVLVVVLEQGLAAAEVRATLPDPLRRRREPESFRGRFDTEQPERRLGLIGGPSCGG